MITDIAVAKLSSDDIVRDLRARTWCKLPYPNHPKGCPNFNHKKTCPLNALLFDDLVTAPYTLVAVGFNLASWANKMKTKHPKWSDRQARCCLYWQGTVRKFLREKCAELLHDDETVLYSPEANGIHVFETCKKVRIVLDRNPQTTVWKVAIIGKKTK